MATWVFTTRKPQWLFEPCRTTFSLEAQPGCKVLTQQVKQACLQPTTKRAVSPNYYFVTTILGRLFYLINSRVVVSSCIGTNV